MNLELYPTQDRNSVVGFFPEFNWKIIIIYNVLDTVTSDSGDEKVKKWRKLYIRRKTLKLELGLQNV